MGISLGDIKTAVINRGISDSYRTIMNEWVNDVYDLMWNYYDWELKQEQRTDFAVTAGTSEYLITTIASDVAYIPYMQDTTNNIRLEETTLDYIIKLDADFSQAGVSTHFCYVDNKTKVRLWPEPSATVTMKVPYYLTKTDLSSDSDEPLFLERNRRVITDGVYARGLEFDNDVRAERAYNKFINGDPNWTRRKKVVGGLKGMVLEEQRQRNKNFSAKVMDPETGQTI